MTRHPRRHPSPLVYHHSPNPSPCPLHPSQHRKHHLSSPVCNVKKPGFALKGLRIVRQSATRPTTSHSSSPRSRSRRANARPVAAKQGVDEDDEHPFMATAFLQFCATCERQIMIPSDSILYCSESCRRKDSSKPSEISRVTIETMTSSPKHSLSASPSPSTPKSIVASMAPTQPPSCSPSPPIRTSVNNHESASALDPTEWKPKIPHRPTNPLTSSEASRYLSLFQKPEPPRIVTIYNEAGEYNNPSNNTSKNNSNNKNDGDTVHPRPVPITHLNSASISTSGQGTLPSLAHSPTTSAASSLLDSPTEPAACVPAMTNPRPPHPSLLPPESATHKRPLAPRYNPSTSASRDFDLVMPYIIADANGEVVPATAVENEKRATTGGCFLSHEKPARGKFVEHS